MLSWSDALTPAVLFAKGPRRTVTLGLDALAEFRALQRRPTEYTGHIDIGADGSVERVVAVPGHNVPPRGADFEVSFHTHTADYDNTRPDHPSRQDIVHLLYTAGVRGEVALHLLLTPRFVFAMRLAPDLAAAATEAAMPALTARVEAAHEEARREARADDGPAFRCAWLAALAGLGVEVDAVGSDADADAAYSRPLMVEVQPLEPSPPRVAAALLGLGVMALAVAMAWGGAPR